MFVFFMYGGVVKNNYNFMGGVLICVIIFVPLQ